MTDNDNPIDRMMPKGDNPEYHRRKAEHRQANIDDATKEALKQHPYLASRIQNTGRGVRQNPPKAASPIAPNAAPMAAPAPEPETRAEHPVPVQAPATVQPTRNIEEDNSHPLLQKLRKDFGIQSIPTEDTTIGDMTFTLRVLDAKSVTAALRFADSISVTSRENDINMQIAMTAFAVIALNKEPLWRVFDVPLEEKERIFYAGEYHPKFDPSEPPERVRMTASVKFMDFLNSEATMDLMGTLWEFYQSKVDPKGSLSKLIAAAKDESTSGGENVEDIPLP